MPDHERLVLSLFTGAGGLDLGFERQGFSHIEAVDIDPWSVATVQKNRPSWGIVEADAREYQAPSDIQPDVLLAGFPCQGFSLGGNRDESDGRNTLYKEVVRVAKASRPRIILIENVLNLRTMRDPSTGKPFATQIAEAIERIGYEVRYDVFRVANYSTPQTRRRFVFVGFRDGAPKGYHFPNPSDPTPIRPFVYELGQRGEDFQLPNHDPQWGFKSQVHVETAEPFDRAEEVVPVRFSRTASDGFPVRSFDVPFPAIDTATIWGWAQGNVRAERRSKDRVNGKFIRNPKATVTLWRIEASRLRGFTEREYARLQTFPDDWEFVGNNKRSVHKQIGNAVPVNFAEHFATNIKAALSSMERGAPFEDPGPNGNLRLF